MVYSYNLIILGNLRRKYFLLIDQNNFISHIISLFYIIDIYNKCVKI